jgi:hypothetical protein
LSDGSLWAARTFPFLVGFFAYHVEGEAKHVIAHTEICPELLRRLNSRTSENSVKKLSEKGFERSSER